MINVHSNDLIQYDGLVPYCYLQDAKQNDIATIEIDNSLVTIYRIHHDDDKTIDIAQYDHDESLWYDILNETFENFDWIVDNIVIEAIINVLENSVAIASR